MPATREHLMQRLGDLGIETRSVEHEAAFTVEQAKQVRGELPGAHSKNLFLKDKKGDLFLVVALEDRAIDLKVLRHLIGARHLSFGKPDLLLDVLGIEPGGVTPFALMNDAAARVAVALDAEMMRAEMLNFHPLTNRATTQITPDDLVRFLRDCGHTPMMIDL